MPTDEHQAERKKVLLWIMGVAVVFAILYPVNTFIANKTSPAVKNSQDAKAQAHNVCVATRDGRMIGNERARVLRQFIQEAITTQWRTYLQLKKNNLSIAKISFRAVKKYKKLKARVKLVPAIVCK